MNKWDDESVLGYQDGVPFGEEGPPNRFSWYEERPLSKDLKRLNAFLNAFKDFGVEPEEVRRICEKLYGSVDKIPMMPRDCWIELLKNNK